MSIYEISKGKWKVDCQVTHPDGTESRKTYTLREGTKKDARAYEVRLTQDMEREWADPELKQMKEQSIKAKGTTFADAWALWLADCKARQNAPSTIAGKETAYRVHISEVVGSYTLDKLTEQKLSEIATELAKRKPKGKRSKGNPLTAKTVNEWMRFIGACLKFAHKRKLIRYSPEMPEPIKYQPSEQAYLTESESNLLVAAVKKEPLTHLIILLCLDCGLRIGEALGVKWDAIDFEQGLLTVRGKMYEGNYQPYTKGKRVKVVALSDRLTTALTNYGKDESCEFVCFDHASKQQKKWAGTKAITRACLAAGITRISWHGLRHSFCTHLVNAGVPSAIAAKAAGHASEQTFRGYTHISGASTRAALAALQAHREGQ